MIICTHTHTHTKTFVFVYFSSHKHIVGGKHIHMNTYADCYYLTRTLMHIYPLSPSLSSPSPLAPYPHAVVNRFCMLQYLPPDGSKMTVIRQRENKQNKADLFALLAPFLNVRRDYSNWFTRIYCFESITGVSSRVNDGFE